MIGWLHQAATAPTPAQITGVKYVAVSARRTDSDAMALVYDVDVRWAGAPDISLLLAPSRKWIIKQRRIGAETLDCDGLPQLCRPMAGPACCTCALIACCTISLCRPWAAWVFCSECAEGGSVAWLADLQDAERSEHDRVPAGKLKVLPRLNFTPAMVVAVKTLHMAAIVRVTLSPVLHDAPFVGGFSFCFLDMPYLDFDLRRVHPYTARSAMRQRVACPCVL